MSAFVHAGGALTVYSVDPLMALSTTGCRKHLHTAFVSLESVPGLSFDDIRPERFDLVGIKRIVPWRHIALPVGDGIDKTCVSIVREVS
jgi:hypothetical protein